MSPRTRTRTRTTSPGVEYAVATLAPADPSAIAEKVATLETEKRISATVADVQRWRDIVASVAAGREPDAETLSDIHDIGRRLKLAPDALAVDVRAVQEEKRLGDQVARSREQMEKTRARRDEIFPEIKRLEKELLALRQELEEYHATAAGLPSLLGARNEHRTTRPLLFADPLAVATRIVAAETSNGLGKISPPQADAAPATAASWE